MSPESRPHILVVDDDEDTRQLIAFALGANRFAVTEVVDGESALAALRAGSFDLVITDYDMPGMTGAEMLKRATREALLGDAPALVVTAHDDPQGLAEDTPLLHKPLDLERLLVQVRAILPERATRKKRAPVPPSSQRKTAKPQKLDLALYVSPHSPASLKARHRMDEVLADFEGCEVHFEVFTPTLVKRSPVPRAWIIGDLTADDVVRDLLTMCGVSRREDPPAREKSGSTTSRTNPAPPGVGTSRPREGKSSSVPMPPPTRPPPWATRGRGRAPPHPVSGGS